MTAIRAFAIAVAMLFPSIGMAQAPSRCEYVQIAAGFNQAALAGGFSPEFAKWLQDPGPAGQYVEPFKAFDNVWYVGGCFVGSWALVTRDGVILIDTMYEPLVEMLVGNLHKAGIPLDAIKYVIVTHGHWDHVGGVGRLKGLLKNARFVMSEKGWLEAASDSRTPRDFAPWKMIEREMVVKDGDVITLGDTKLTLYETPGHTPGTISFGYDVVDGSRTYHAFTVGGLAVGPIRGSKLAEQFVQSVDRIERLANDSQRPVHVYLATHANQTHDLAATSEGMRARKGGGDNPFVGQAIFLKELARLRTAGEQKIVSEKEAGR